MLPPALVGSTTTLHFGDALVVRRFGDGHLGDARFGEAPERSTRMVRLGDDLRVRRTGDGHAVTAVVGSDEKIMSISLSADRRAGERLGDERRRRVGTRPTDGGM